MFTYLNLPREAEEEAATRCRDFVKSHIDAITTMVFLQDYSLGQVTAKLHKLMGSELIHSCYFASPLCLRMIADWIAMPAELFDAQPVMIMGPDIITGTAP